MKLSYEEAGAMLGRAQRTSGAPLTLEQASHRAAESLQNELKELIAVLPIDWPQRLFSWLRLNGPTGDRAITTGDVFRLEAWMKTGLLALIDRGMSPVIMTPEAESDLAVLRKEVAFHGYLPTSSPAEAEPVASSEPEPMVADPIAECAHDFRTMASSDFRAKWMRPDTRHVYDAAVSSGRV